LKWMLDTDTCIAIIKRKPDHVLKSLRRKSVGQIGVSSIVLGELALGAARSERPAQNAAALQEFLLAIEVAAFDRAAALEYGAVRASLERTGRPIGSLDTLIAGHALALDVILVTHNTREFGRVAGLRVEDWLQS
jgi:tRNA(fMet)-specific endonuclease VapC